MYVWWKEKKTVFLYVEKKKDFSLRIYVQKDWLRDHTSWAPFGIEMKIKGILKYWFWISPHQGTLSILCFRIQGYMLSLMNEVDPWLLLPLCVLYEIQNQFFQQHVPIGTPRMLMAFLGARFAFEFWSNLDSFFEDFWTGNCT